MYDSIVVVPFGDVMHVHAPLDSYCAMVDGEFKVVIHAFLQFCKDISLFYKL